MQNYNIDFGRALDMIMSQVYYKYRGHHAENLLNGNVLYCQEEMTKEEFRKKVDRAYESIRRSLNRLKK